METRASNRPIRLLVGPGLLATVAIGFNALAWRAGRPTISASVRTLRHHPLGGWLLGAIVGGLIAHWFLEEAP
jgi:hypothetical protein